MNQEFKFKTAQNSKNLRLNSHSSLNSKLGITLRVSVTSATILTAKRTIIMFQLTSENKGYIKSSPKVKKSLLIHVG